jgi:uncharacterized membrane protein YdjX (TVP38/TMEM64 family)
MTRSNAVAILRLALLPGLVAIALTIAWKTGYFDLDHRQQLARWVNGVRQIPGVQLVFVALMALGIAFCLPSNAGTWLAGALFGVWLGAALAFAGGLLATVIGYLTARTIARGPARRLFGEHRLLRALKERDDIGTLFQLRVIPMAPFAVLTYVAGIAGVSLRRLVLATAIGGVPACLAHAFIGTQLMRGLTSTSGDAPRALMLAGFVTATMLTASLVVGIVRRRRSAHNLSV